MKKKIWLAAGLLGALLLGGCAAKNAAMDNANPGFTQTTDGMDKSDWGLGTNGGGQKLDAMQDFSGKEEAEEYQSVSEKLIRTITMRVQTKEFETLLSYLETKVSEVGGYIEHSQIYGGDADYSGYRSAELTLRIPQNSLDLFVSGIGENASVVYKSERAQNVALQYADTETHLKALQIEQERFLELLGKAESLDAIITLERHLTELRYEIESYAAKLRVYDNQVSYSTINLDISEVKRTITAEPDPTLFSRMKEGFINTFYNIQDGAGNFLVWFVTNCLYLLIFGVVVGVAAVLLRKAVKKSEAKSAAARKAYQQKMDEEQHDRMDTEK